MVTSNATNSVRFERNLLVLLALVSVLPFLMLAFYSHAAGDDFVFANYYRQLGWVEFQKFYYLKWQGAYTTNALMGSPLNPVAHSRFDLLWIACWLAVFSMVGCVGMLLRYLTKSWTATITGTSAVLVAYFYQAPSPAEGLFWLNASLGYQVSANLGLLLLLLILKTFAGERPRSGYWVAAAFMVVILMGTNFIVGLLAGFAIGMAMLCNWRNPVQRWWWAGLTALAALALAVAVLAPGNSMRMADADQKLALIQQNISFSAKLVHGVAHGAALFAYSFVNWLGDGVLLALSLLLVPSLARINRHGGTPLSSSFRSQALVLLTGVLMLALPFFPTYLAQGGPPATRILNVVYFNFILVWLFALYTVVSWLVRSGQILQYPLYVKVLLAMFLVASLLSDENHSLSYGEKGQNSNNVVIAYRDWLGGSASQYDSQENRRYSLSQAPTSAGLALDSLQAKPRTIYLGDLHADTTFWFNQAYAKFFNKKYVVVNRKGKTD